MFARAFSLYRRHFAALMLTAAVALVPANLLMAGSVRFGLAAMGTSTGPREPPQKDELKSGDLQGADRADRARVLGKESLQASTALDDLLRPLVPLLYAAVMVIALLLAGLTLAHAALVPLVLDLSAGRPGGPAQAWAAVAARSGGLTRTWLLALALVALGSVFCVLPGVVLAAGFAFAAPVTMLEGLAGRAALERSWALMKGQWPRVLAAFALIVLCTAAGSAVAALTQSTGWRLAISALVRLISYPLPLVALVLLYQEVCDRAVASTSSAAPLPDSSAPGSAGTTRP